jgi:hypothetical protein
MKTPILFAALLAASAAAHADDCAATHAKMQALMTAVGPGDKKVWLAILDPRFAQIDESGAVLSYKQTMDEILPLPKGASGTIATDQWVCTPFGDTLVATELDDEHENFHGQKIHALYRSVTTWLRVKGDWKLIGMQTIALQQDPPAVALPETQMKSYVGLYRAGPDYTYTITERGGHLYGATNDGKPTEMKAELTDVFFTPGAPRTRKIFQHGADGKITGFLSRREERDLVFTKEN